MNLSIQSQANTISKHSFKKVNSKSKLDPNPTIETQKSQSNSISLRSRSIDKNQSNVSVYNTLNLPQVARVADRYKISDRAAAALSTAVLVDVGVINDQNTNMVIDKNKIRRKRIKERNDQIEIVSFEGIRAIYFDGRIDHTIVNKNGAKKVVNEEHIAFVQQPNSYFIGHKAVLNGTALAIKESIMDIVAEKEIPVDEIDAMGCDGTVTNTGCRAGVIRLLELEWEKIMQWIICMLHLNELPLRALIEKLDGPYKSKDMLSGPIGKMLKDVESLPIVEFEQINFHCEPIDRETISFSTDQQYLIDICTAISVGCVTPHLANRAIGPLNKVRWATTASRILRLYVSDENPSFNLRILTQYVMFVYTPMLFQLKYRSSIVNGAVHLANMVKAIRFLPEPALSIVKNSISHNAFFAHPEHILLGTVNDDREDVRIKGWRSILKARSKTVDSMREFKVPKINFECDGYLNLIEDSIEADPPVLRKIPVNEENIGLLASKKIEHHDFGSFLKNMPLHTQSVERTVKLVTESAKKVCGEDARDGLIANTIASRNSMPKFDSKQDFRLTQTAKHLSV